jgi:hypothetical protein
LLTFELVHLLGREETKTATTEQLDILRLMTPVTKLFTARSAIQTASEVVEGFGGVGYIEDAGIAVHLRDSQVFPIWEGATNVLSLDMLRVMQKSAALRSLHADIEARLKSVKGLEAHVQAVKSRLQELSKNIELWSRQSPEEQIAGSRSLAFFLGRFYSYVLLLSWAGAESPEQQRALTPWLDYFRASYIQNWQPLSTDDVKLNRALFDVPQSKL